LKQQVSVTLNTDLWAVEEASKMAKNICDKQEHKPERRMVSSDEDMAYSDGDLFQWI
jgi:hypothetical protein